MAKPVLLLLACLLVILALLSCGESSDDDNDVSATDDDNSDDNNDNDDVTPPEPWHWELSGDALTVYYDDRALFTLTGAAVLEFQPKVWSLFGFFFLNAADLQDLPLTLGLQNGEPVLMTGDATAGRIEFEKTTAGNFRLRIIVDEDFRGRGVRLIYRLGENDRFWGFGEQYNFLEFRGKTLSIWVQEQGVGRSPNFTIPPIGKLTDTYFPMPYFLDPKRGAGLLVENTEYMVFDLGANDAAHWSVDVWNGARVSTVFYAGPKPADVVAQHTAETGRPSRLPPNWAFGGVWLGTQEGPENVASRLQTALDADVPVSAVWVQDWVGERNFGVGNHGVKYHWTVDEELYPDLPGFIADLEAQGVYFLGYFNPFIVPRYDQWDEAVAKGYVIHKPDGSPYKFPIITFLGSLLDVTNPEACDWFQEYARAATAMGQRGWMADFGEWLPFAAKLYAGRADAEHNLYPTKWHELSREVLEEAYPDGQYVLLTRSGYTGEAATAQIVWAGDQEASWDEYDGLPTVVTAGLTIGLSGVPFFTHDIAGFSGGPSTKELFMRWTELGALTPIMRTHDGLQREDNHRFDSDAETLAHFAQMAQLHASLLPYFLEVASEAIDRGLPMVRHTMLVDPDWDLAYEANEQWLIGDDLLFAPVVREGENSVTVYFPEGSWRHLLTNEIYDGRQVLQVDAPIGVPAAFRRE